MSEFDPYFKWLGIPPEDQPPDHYRLLGIPAFTSDADVIASAIDRQVAHVRTFALGPHSDDSQRILNELAAARVCLESPEKKAAYDNSLRARVPETQQVVGTSEASPTEPTSINGESTYEVLSSRRTSRRQRSRTSRRRRSRTHDRRVIGIIGTATTLIAVIGLVVFMWPEAHEPAASRDVAGTTGEQDLPVVGTSTVETRSVEKDALRSLPMNLQQGLVAYYPFNGNANDESGNGHHGEVHGSEAFMSDRRGASRNILFTAKGKDYITVGDHADLGLGNETEKGFTLSLWFYGNSPNDKCLNGIFISKRMGKGIASASIDYALMLEVQDERGLIWGTGPSRGFGGSNTTSWMFSGVNPSSNTWHHLLVSYQSTAADKLKRIYFDGALIKEGGIGTKNATNKGPVHIGPWNGSLDDVRIYNRALSSGEVQQLYEYEASGVREASVDLSDREVKPLPSLASTVPVAGCQIHLPCNADDIVVRNGSPAIRNVIKEDDCGEVYGVVPVKKDGRSSLCVTGSRDAKVRLRNRGLGPAHTMCMWIVPQKKQDILTLSRLGDASFCVNGWRLSNRTLYLEVYKGSSFASAASLVQYDRWQHVALSVDFPTGKGVLYHDGKVVGVEKKMKRFGTKAELYFGFGAGNENGDFTFKGYMSDIRIYNRSLSAAEIKTLYEFEKP